MWACRMDHIDHFQLLSDVAAQRGELDDEDFEHDHQGRTWMHWSVRRTEPLECLRVGGSQHKLLTCLKTWIKEVGNIN